MTDTVTAQQHEKIWKRKANTETKVLMIFITFFLGHFGIHRFISNQIGMGVLYLLTFGLLGIGTIVDIILIATDNWNYGNFEIKFSSPVNNGY